jgi:predicted Zn-dependent peptidase
MDRTKAPDLVEISSISLVEPAKRKEFPVPFYTMDQIPNSTSRIELYFNAGSIKGKVGLASVVSGLLLSGTDKMSSTEIHSALDDLGGFHDVSLGHESVVVSLYGLNDKLFQIIRLYCESLINVTFYENEIRELKRDRKQRLKINLEKVSFLAQREFSKYLFHDSLYGRIIEEEDYEGITRDEIIDFHRQYYLSGLFKIVLVGDFDEEQIVKIQDVLLPIYNQQERDFEKKLNNHKGKYHLEKEGALQTAIRIGRVLFNRKHEDYIDFLILNTILGEYFGSRLMSNLREDKGYTYGIGSMLSEFHETGYFLIATEVGKEHANNAIQEIENEIIRLQKEFVSDEELDLVRNYMLGQLLKSADGPYSMTDLCVGLYSFDLGVDFYDKYLHKIKTISPQRLQELAKKYLNWEHLTIVSAG